MTTSADYVFLHGGGHGGWVWNETIAALELQGMGKFGRAVQAQEVVRIDAAHHEHSAARACGSVAESALTTKYQRLGGIRS